MFAGDIGIYTGYKPGAFSVTENERTPAGTVQSLLTNVHLIFYGVPEISWLIRDTFTVCDTFECAYSMLSTMPIIADGYIILAGLKDYEGAIISRNRAGIAHVD